MPHSGAASRWRTVRCCTRRETMLETFTIATFSPHQSESFALQAGDTATLTLTLAEVTALGPAATPGGRSPFALLFLGPVSPPLPQRIYRLAHETIGTFDLFLVPLGPVPGGLRYEAIFA